MGKRPDKSSSKWIINKHKQEVALSKQNVGADSQKDKLEFKLFLTL